MNKEDFQKLLNRTCKKLPSDHEEKDRKELHRIKMEMKEQLRNHRYQNRLKPRTRANISWHHPHAMDTPVEHEKRKNNS